MTFVNAMREDMTHTYTENGAKARNTSGDACLDLFSCVGSLRNTDDTRKWSLFQMAWYEDALTALRILFYARDIRGGLGERETFRTILKRFANKYPKILKKNLWAIPFYGRWDDLYELIGTSCESDMWKFMKQQLQYDIENMQDCCCVSLLAKWVKRGDEKSKAAHDLGVLTANKLGYSVYEFKRIIVSLRKYLDIVEVKMCTQRWDEINYSTVPSRASMIYRKAFEKHDHDRYTSYIDSVNQGDAKINTSTLYPYDIIEKMWRMAWSHESVDDVLETLWANLPDYVGRACNAMVIADTSGSMQGRPMYSAVALAIYFAQRNRGPYHNLWMTFSEHPQYHELRGDSLLEILRNLDQSGWGMNTNLEAALQMVLNTAIDNHVSNDDLPKSLVIISDMEIDSCEKSGWSFYDYMKEEYAKHGYDIPNIVFWNVNSRHDVFHADKSRRGVQLVSGQSAGTFKNLMGSIGMTPLEFMHSIIDSERYSHIEI